MNTKRSIFLKCLLTGLIYVVITCIVQVPIGNAVYAIPGAEADPMFPPDVLPFLMLSLFVVGVVLAWFFYLYGDLFASNTKWKQGMKFSLFVCLSNYIPQVFFLDAAKGFRALITGGFPVVQVEVFDCIILVGTALCMVRFMPCRTQAKKANRQIHWWRGSVCGVVFAACLVLLQEVLLPLLGFGSMADGLDVAKENLLFFYGVMLAGFFLTGLIVSICADKLADARKRKRFFLGYGVLVWCFFDLTMIPLGFGVLATVLFVLMSLIAFDVTRIVHQFLQKNKRYV